MAWRRKARYWRQLSPEIAMEGFGPETLSWLAENPDWDPRVRLSPLAEREQVKARPGEPFFAEPNSTMIGSRRGERPAAQPTKEHA